LIRFPDKTHTCARILRTSAMYVTHSADIGSQVSYMCKYSISSLSCTVFVNWICQCAALQQVNSNFTQRFWVAFCFLNYCCKLVTTHACTWTRLFIRGEIPNVRFIAPF
jgi:hypothetical protein